LGLQLVTLDEGRKPKVQTLPPIGSSHHRTLDEAKLVAEVLQGVSDASKDLGSLFSVEAIEYVLNDTPPESVYRGLAALIVGQVTSGNVADEDAPNRA
jgi:hypothetical protein